MINKLGEAEKKYELIGEKLSSESATSNMEEYKKLMREYKILSPIVEKFREYKKYKAKTLSEVETDYLNSIKGLEQKTVKK